VSSAFHQNPCSIKIRVTFTELVEVNNTKHQTTNNEQHTTNNEQQTTNNEQQTTQPPHPVSETPWFPRLQPSAEKRESCALRFRHHQRRIFHHELPRLEHP